MSDVRQVAVVTGGASGIGLEIVRHLADEGASVVALDRDGAACAQAAEALAAFGPRVRFVTGDVATHEDAQTAVDTALGAFGRIDVLCNNAAVHPTQLIEDHVLETWRETFRVNVEGTLLCSQLVLPHMRRQGGGVIVNMGSISGEVPYARGGAYAASKAAVAMLTRVLALEAGPYGVRVNCIAAGAIAHRPPRSGSSDASHIPIGRRGTPADVARLVAYLASDAAGYLTGSVIVLDGGATAGRKRP